MMRVALGALGVGLMGFAVLGAVGDPDVSPVPHVLFLAAVVAAHDGVVLPLAIGAGALVRRYVPARLRGIVHSGLFVSAVLAIVGFGAPHGLLVGLALVWLTVAVLLLIRRKTARE